MMETNVLRALMSETGRLRLTELSSPKRVISNLFHYSVAGPEDIRCDGPVSITSNGRHHLSKGSPDNERRTYAQVLHPGCWIIAPCCVRPFQGHDSRVREGGSHLPFRHDSGASCEVHPRQNAEERIRRLRRANIR